MLKYIYYWLKLKTMPIWFPVWYRLYALPLSALHDLQVRKHKPKFKRGDCFKLDMHDYIAVFKVERVVTTKDGKYYKLKGINLLSDTGRNPHKTEFKEYNPYCKYADEMAIKDAV